MVLLRQQPVFILSFVFVISTHNPIYAYNAFIKFYLKSMIEACTLIRCPVNHQWSQWIPLHILSYLAVILSLLIITTILHGFRRLRYAL